MITATEVVLPGVVEPDGLLVRDHEIPAPGRHQARLRMLATGVSYAENSMRRNRYPGQPKFPFVPGYDLVGEVEAVGPGADPGLVGRRVAAVTKTGAWATHVLLDARDCVPVDADPVTVESVLLNGITAWQMLNRSARVRDGGTILVHGASGGVGGLLVQLARARGIRVIGTGSERSHGTLRALGAEPLDYRDPELEARLTEMAPQGFDAVFDNIGGPSFARSFRALAPRGTLVAYGTNSQREAEGSLAVAFLGILARFALWTAAPNGGRSATFYNFWAGKSIRPAPFRARLSADLGAVLAHVADGTLAPEIAGRYRLSQASEALAFADTRARYGKVILEP